MRLLVPAFAVLGARFAAKVQAQPTITSPGEAWQHL